MFHAELSVYSSVMTANMSSTATDVSLSDKGSFGLTIGLDAPGCGRGGIGGGPLSSDSDSRGWPDFQERDDSPLGRLMLGLDGEP